MDRKRERQEGQIDIKRCRKVRGRTIGTQAHRQTKRKTEGQLDRERCRKVANETICRQTNRQKETRRNRGIEGQKDKEKNRGTDR